MSLRPSDSPTSSVIPRPLKTLQDIPALQEKLVAHDTEGFPKELIAEDQHYWILWQPIPNNLTNCTKILKKPVTRAWQTADASKAFWRLTKLQKKFSTHTPTSFGFVFQPTHPFICIDIDLATDDNNALVEALHSYTEWSPSGAGLHVIIQTETLEDKGQLIRFFGTGKRNKTEKRDLFISNGYCTITGKQLPIFPTKVRTLDYEELYYILEKYFLSNVTSLPIRHKDAEAAQKELFEEAIADSSSGTKKATKKAQLKRLTVAQVKNLLNQIPVQTLTSDIFEKLWKNELCILDLKETEEARTPWLKIGQAIHNNFKGSIEGYYTWDQWSQQGNKYDAQACISTWESFKELAGPPITIGALVKLVRAQHPQFPDITTKGLLMGTAENFFTYVDFYKFQISHNEITKDLIIEPPPHIAKRWRIDKLREGQIPSLSEICEFILSDLLILGFPQSAFNNLKVKKFITTLSKAKSFNPIRDYFNICGTTWDNKDHLSALLETIHTSRSDKQFRPAYKMFIRKWLIQVVAAACHPAAHPVRLNHVVIFSGAQSIGKTRWVESLFPKELQKYCAADKEVRISNFRSDNVKQTMELSNTLIANINEIDRLFKAANFSDFKAFLDQTKDNIVLPYGEAPVEMSRRTVFIGSTNLTRFLKDHTGNRRFNVIHTEKLDFKHAIDINQLWGQAYNWYKKGEKWWLNSSIEAEQVIITHRDQINMRSMYMGSDALIEQLEDIYDVDAHKDTFVAQTFKDIRLILGLTHLTTNSKAFNQTKRALAIWSQDISGLPPMPGTGNRPKIFYTMPPVRNGLEQDYKEIDKQAELTALKKRMQELQDELMR